MGELSQLTERIQILYSYAMLDYTNMQRNVKREIIESTKLKLNFKFWAFFAVIWTSQIIRRLSFQSQILRKDNTKLMNEFRSIYVKF